jgi:uncharacterized glyoxalase superfamily protein PhnB
MKPTPPGWPRISSALFYQDPARAIDWLCRAFGFEVRIKVEGEGGTIVHSELELGPDGLIMVGGERPPDHRPEATHRKSPRSLDGANTQCVMAFVDDVDAHYAHAREVGATIISEPKTTDYGEDYWTDRGYEVADLEGHHWWFVQRISTGKK